MKEIVCVKMENEMDLILAHKRSMKLCELMGLSLVLQTSIATAVSEVARCAIEFGKNAELKLGFDLENGKRKFLAIIHDAKDNTPHYTEAIRYAKRLVDEIETIKTPREVQIILKQRLNGTAPFSQLKLDSYINYFKLEPPLSPYDEIRRNNILLFELAEQLKASESDFRVLTDSLPQMMFSVDNRGKVTYTNKWLRDFLDAIPGELNSASWENFIHPSDFPLFTKEINDALLSQTALEGQFRFRKRSSGDFLWHMMSVLPLKNEKQVITRWIGFIVNIHAQKVVEQTLKDNKELKATQESLFENQKELQNKVIELNRSNYELEQFAHLASHDLQEPLRKLFFYADVLKTKYSDQIDDAGVRMLDSMSMAAGRMKELINDLLNYSQLQQQRLTFESVDLNSLFTEISRDLDIPIKEKNATVKIALLPVIQGNAIRLRQLFSNLLSNSLKYSRKNVPPEIDISVTYGEKNIIVAVRDNGIGFEEEFKDKIFGLFERLHTRDEFPGTGIGLSICKKIAELHHGSITAKSKSGEYSIFEVVLPIASETISVEHG